MRSASRSPAPGGSLAAKQGYAGSFFTGVLAVVVATPCTAPFMGAAIGYALAEPAAVTFAVFTALALGLAAPYVVLTLEPAWTRLLPRPGAWMDVLKQAISVPIFATVIWLAWVLAQAYGAALVAALLASLLLLAIAGWFLGRWPARRWAAAVAALIVLVVVAASVTAPRELAEAPSNPQAQLPSESSAARSAAWQPWSADAVEPLACRRAAGVCGFHREVVPELPVQRARCSQPARSDAGVRRPRTWRCLRPTGRGRTRPSRRRSQRWAAAACRSTHFIRRAKPILGFYRRF